ncbi:hypothetical protein [Marinicella rhabdoformis]|uniref:hypothetical protein n=1 Tax=Marinicella rhabdoformis TaxID=2580566 RepID=UPI0012AEC03F|nr:hypothetical protein [Marinicella rhabdoformis]
MSENKVTIVLSGKRFDLNLNDKASIQEMPWKDRKQLISLLETIKEAEHIKPKAEDKIQPDNHVANINSEPATTPPPTTAVKLDPEVKPSEADIDSMMERFVMEGQKDRPKIPDKSSIYKFLLIIMAVLLGVALIF